MSHLSVPEFDHPNAGVLLGQVLRDVSRSFYLTLRILPASIRPQIGLAYLLARASDTIADTEAVPIEERLQVLDSFRAQIASNSGTFRPLMLAARQENPAERILLERLNEVLQLFYRLPEGDARCVRQVLKTITEGQRRDLERFPTPSSGVVGFIDTAAELDEYTFQVAGCVGEFWTHMCLRHLRPMPSVDPSSLIQRGIRFGKGLQLVNILRDIPADLRNGRCYLPRQELNHAGLAPEDLLNPQNESALRPAYNHWLTRAADHLAAGWSYTLDLPRSWIRVRLACAWPILIGIQTLARLQTGAVLNPDIRIKLSRAEIRTILRRSIVSYPFRGRWERLFPSS